MGTALDRRAGRGGAERGGQAAGEDGAGAASERGELRARGGGGRSTCWRWRPTRCGSIPRSAGRCARGSGSTSSRTAAKPSSASSSPRSSRAPPTPSAPPPERPAPRSPERALRLRRGAVGHVAARLRPWTSKAPGLNLSAPRAQVDARGGARDADLARVAGVAAEARALREAAEERRAALRCRRALARAARCPPPRAPCPEPGAGAAAAPPARALPRARRGGGPEPGAGAAAAPLRSPLRRARRRPSRAADERAGQGLPGRAARGRRAPVAGPGRRGGGAASADPRSHKSAWPPSPAPWPRSAAPAALLIPRAFAPARCCAWRIHLSADSPRNGGESPGLLCPASLPGLTVRGAGRGVGGAQ